MVPISDLRPGMKVKIVDQWGLGCGESSDGRMDHWLGQIVTIQKIYSPYFAFIEEDEAIGERWFWYPEAIDHIVHDDELLPGDEDFSIASDDAFLSLFS